MESEPQFDELTKAFSVYLKEKGGRFTPERATIIRGIQQCMSHFTLDELKVYLDEEHFRVSQATLYNTLNELAVAGFVAKFMVKEKAYYEVVFNKNAHCHQICTSCGKISEFYNIDLDTMILTSKYKRFSISDYTLMTYGICSACKALQKRAGRKKKTKK